MDKDLRSYLKIYSDWLTPEVCQETVDELEKVEGQFQTHQFYDYQNNSNHSYEHELAVTWSNVKHIRVHHAKNMGWLAEISQRTY
jgi:hypothetical protein